MSNFNVEDILADLEAEAEKTAEDTFLTSLTEETENVSEEKVAEEKAQESTEEKTAEETTDEVASKEGSTEEKTAENTEETTEEVATEEKVAEEKGSKDPIDAATEKVAETQSIPSDPELVKMAQEFGRIAAHSLFSELAALGVAMPTNKDMAVPLISQTSRPQASPVTVARDAAEQEAAGHAPYDNEKAHVPDGAGGYMKHEKKASFVSEDLVKRMYTNIYSEEEK